MARHAFEVVRGDGAGHPAVTAWRTLGNPPVAPSSLHVLPGRRPSAIYRLGGIGPGGSAIIAKRCDVAGASIERTVYEDVLPHLPVTAPRYYGFADDGSYGWLFLEDVGEERYAAANPEHLALAGRWLGSMHGSAARAATAASRRLPDGGPARYLALLRAARDAIRANASNPALLPDDVDVLETMLAQYDVLERRWRWLEDSCEGMPATLVHGDFRPKNAYLRTHRAEVRLFPIDWETAGWGMPAADLARVDVTAYGTALREWCPEVDVGLVRRVGAVGRVFRFIAAIGWTSPALAYDTPDLLSEPLASMRVLAGSLSEAVRAAAEGE